MNTFSFIKKIGKIFQMPANGKQLPAASVNNNNNQMEKGLQINGQPVNNGVPQSTSGFPELNPTVNIMPQVHSISNVAAELNYIKIDDLKSIAVNECSKSGGSFSKLQHFTNIVIMSYKMEAAADEEKIKSETAWEINQINNRIIKLNNDIANIKDFLIPDKEKELQKYDRQLDMLANSSQYDLKTDLGSDLYTIIQVSQARTRQHIRDLHAKIIELKTLIEQEKNRIDTMRLQMKNLNMFTRDVLSRRLSIFFSGWIDGLIGIEASESTVENARNFADTFINKRMDEYFVKNVA
jgi:hypothetical protein